MKGLVLAGGHGTRLRPLTFSGNKHLLPIANKPMLFYGLEHLRNAGITDVGVITGPIKEGLVETLGDGSRFGLKITFIDQPQPKGLAHAVLLAQDFIGQEPFVMYLGDNLLKHGVTDFIKAFNEKKANCVVGAYHVKDPSRFGVIETKGEKIVRVVEKPKKPKSDLALVGVYVFDKYVFDVAANLKPSWRGELEITDAIQGLIDQGRSVLLEHVNGWWKDTGRPDDLLEANQLILASLQPVNEGRLSRDTSISGPIALGRGSKTVGRVKMLGPIIIGEDCTIGPDVYIGPYTAVGDKCVLGRMEVENSIIMKGCNIGSSKKIVDSIIGSNSTIMNGGASVHQGHRLIIGESSFAQV